MTIDFTKQYKKQREKFRPWAIFMLVIMTALTIILPILAITIQIDKSFVMTYVAICVGLLILTVPSLIKASKCPNCKKYMGRDLSRFCPVCGVQIQK